MALDLGEIPEMATVRYRFWDIVIADLSSRVDPSPEVSVAVDRLFREILHESGTQQRE